MRKMYYTLALMTSVAVAANNDITDYDINTQYSLSIPSLRMGIGENEQKNVVFFFINNSKSEPVTVRKADFKILYPTGYYHECINVKKPFTIKPGGSYEIVANRIECYDLPYYAKDYILNAVLLNSKTEYMILKPRNLLDRQISLHAEYEISAVVKSNDEEFIALLSPNSATP